MAPPRRRADLCPGVLRPWPAEDGALVRLRLVGGRTTLHQLRALLAVAERHGDGRIHLTARANLQLRALPLTAATETPAALPAALPETLVEEIAATGLLPSPAHELVRNILVSPLTGLRGGRADLRPVAAELDARLCADPDLAALPGRFLFVLDDGRGDLLDRPLDLGLVALDDEHAQLRIGATGWGQTLRLADAPAALADAARAFVVQRGSGPTAPWHIDELTDPQPPLHGRHPRDPRADVHTPPLPPGPDHLCPPDGALDAAVLDQLSELTEGTRSEELVVTPWRGVLIPDLVAEQSRSMQGSTR